MGHPRQLRFDPACHRLAGERGVVVNGDAPAELIRRQCETRRPALLVMGAFGHSRLRDSLFGSTTRSLVAAPPCPLLVYH